MNQIIFGKQEGPHLNLNIDHVHPYHHPYSHAKTYYDSKQVHLDPLLKLQLAVPPSRNKFFKFIHAANKSHRSNMQPVLRTDGSSMSGNWLIYTPLNQIDEAWLRVKEATELGHLGYRSIVRTVKDDESDTKVIAVCTYNAFDVSDVLRVRMELHDLGFTSESGEDRIKYKTHAETEAEIYYEDSDQDYGPIPTHSKSHLHMN